MRGKIASGLGQGQYFISREGYSRQFLQHLGFVPFPGTLNVLLDEPCDCTHTLSAVINFPGTLNVLLDEPFPARASQAIKIEGFAEEGRSFGECKCYRIKLNGIEAAVVRPERSRYPPELIEVIAPVQLRQALGLEEGGPFGIEN
jgi:riboflavin kinase